MAFSELIPNLCKGLDDHTAVAKTLGTLNEFLALAESVGAEFEKRHTSKPFEYVRGSLHSWNDVYVLEPFSVH